MLDQPARSTTDKHGGESRIPEAWVQDERTGCQNAAGSAIENQTWGAFNNSKHLNLPS